MAQPTIQYDGFMYEEGPDLDEDEVADYAKFLGRTLNALPAGGIKDSSMVEVSDQAQKLELSIIVTHQVCPCCQLRSSGCTHAATTLKCALTHVQEPAPCGAAASIRLQLSAQTSCWPSSVQVTQCVRPRLPCNPHRPPMHSC